MLLAKYDAEMPTETLVPLVCFVTSTVTLNSHGINLNFLKIQLDMSTKKDAELSTVT
jgi:hypothetical protein